MRKYYDRQPDAQPITTSSGTSETEPLPVRPGSVCESCQMVKRRLEKLYAFVQITPSGLLDREAVSKRIKWVCEAYEPNYTGIRGEKGNHEKT